MGDQNTVHLLPKNKKYSYTSVPMTDMVNSAVFDKHGYLWVGSSFLTKFEITQSGKLNKIKEFTPDYSDSTALPGWFISKLYLDANQKLWVATSNGLGVLVKETDDRLYFKQYKKLIDGKEEGIPANLVWDIFENKEGKMWVTTYSGMGLLDPVTGKSDNFYFSKKKNSIPSNNTKSIIEASNGVVWVTTEGSGVASYNPKTGEFRTYRSEHGLAANTVYSVIEDKEGYLWFSTINGLSHLNPVDHTFDNFSVTDGLQGRGFSTLSFYHDLATDDIYLGGENGINYFNPREIVKENDVPSLDFVKFKVNNEELFGGKKLDGQVVIEKAIWEIEEIEPKHDQNTIYIEFSTAEYASAQNILYQYRLKGVDKDWKTASNDNNFVEYTVLPPGVYEFQVKSTNADGYWNVPVKTLSIEIVPPYWQTLWFKALVLSLTIISLVSFYKIRIRSLKAAKILLENEVAIRTEELQASNEQLSTLNSDLVNKQEEITQLAENLQAVNQDISEKNERLTDSIKYAKTIQNAVLPKADEFEDLFSEHFILFKAKDIVSGDFYWLHQVENRTYIAAIDCTGHGVPGAFMSLIGTTLLNKIVVELKIYDTAEILHTLHIEIQKALNQENDENSDGMDLCLCCLEKSSADGVYEKLFFTGAKNSLYIIDKDLNPIEQLKADNISIGGVWRKEKQFSVQERFVNQGDMIYLFTDGYPDQCDPERRRFSRQRLLDEIESHKSEPLKKQGTLLEESLTAFQLSAEQRDDITVLGIRV